jgi:integrase
VEPDSFSHAVQRIGARIGLPGLRLHDLRHGYATTLLAAGVHPKVVSEALGHASVAFTLDRYSHVLPGMGEVAAAAIDQALGSSTIS